MNRSAKTAHRSLEAPPEEGTQSGDRSRCFQQFLDDWRADAASGSTGQSTFSGGDVAALAGHFDSWATLIRTRSRTETLHRLIIGMTGASGYFTQTEARWNLLVLGPPRSSKTVGVPCPCDLRTPGPVVSTSAKDDVYRATAIVRARSGRFWYYDPLGGQDAAWLLPAAVVSDPALS